MANLRHPGAGKDLINELVMKPGKNIRQLKQQPVPKQPTQTNSQTPRSKFTARGKNE